ncbi:hypothetical protein [Bacillus sp. 165]|uniref:hypothetical protein n=1 Tax=Bacillus sp. 165 TaxID=1529117 RepID=UPI001ADBA625|nr:hypothetical protein [Bacillus sp. 165]MBO9129486.1 hypothetical protein [Bacillus sp. 165]
MRRIVIVCLLVLSGCQAVPGHLDTAHCIQAPCQPKVEQNDAVRQYYVRIAPAVDYTALKIRMERTDAEINPSGPWFWYVTATPETADDISHIPGVQYMMEVPVADIALK